MRIPPDVQINPKENEIVVSIEVVKIKAFGRQNQNIILVGFTYQYAAVFLLLKFSVQCQFYS